MTATPTVNFNVFFKKIDSRIALTLVLPRTGIYEEARFWFSTLAFRRRKRSMFFGFRPSVFNTVFAKWFYFFSVDFYTDLSMENSMDKPVSTER